jgi:hypothetical protein
MKFIVQFYTGNKINQTETTYQPEMTKDRLMPIKIIRSASRAQAAINRYRYDAVIITPDDCPRAGEIQHCYINRKQNPKFKPKDYDFIDNVAQPIK